MVALSVKQRGGDTTQPVYRQQDPEIDIGIAKKIRAKMAETQSID